MLIAVNPLNAKDVYIHPHTRDSATNDVHIRPQLRALTSGLVVHVRFPWLFNQKTQDPFVVLLSTAFSFLWAAEKLKMMEKDLFVKTLVFLLTH